MGAIFGILVLFALFGALLGLLFLARREAKKREGVHPSVETQVPGRSLRSKLYIGMAYDEVIALLGTPVGTTSGTDLLRVRGSGSVVGSDAAMRGIAAQLYGMWKRPEGVYNLTFTNGVLSSIYSAPD